jgi:hypothetical protein
VTQYSLPDARFEIFTAVKIQVEIFWVVTLCSLAVGYQRSKDRAASIFRAKLYPITTLNVVTTHKIWTRIQRAVPPKTDQSVRACVAFCERVGTCYILGWGTVMNGCNFSWMPMKNYLCPPLISSHVL